MTAPTLLLPTCRNSPADTAHELVTGDKGLLAVDESIPTCNKRFARLGITQNEPNRRAYRELIMTAPGLGDSISGVTLCDETIRQHTTDGVPFLTILAEAGIIAGIKVDAGAKPMAGHGGEKVTEGLDGLRERLADYVAIGARFAKWRAVFTIGHTTPSRPCIEANAHALARYAALCQEAGLVPIVEPEVLMVGDHTLARCSRVTEDVLDEVFSQLRSQGVVLELMLLKPNMILTGSTCPAQESTRTVADVTITCLRRAVPAAVAGIAFLSGGQSGDLACSRLNAINTQRTRLPWQVAFSFGRAIQQPALTIWDGPEAELTRAQQALLARSRANQVARRDEHTPIGVDGAPVSITGPRKPTQATPQFEQADAHHEH